MVQGRGQSRFPNESFPESIVFGQLKGEDLQRNDTG
jgi:hypothetical protein